MATYFENNAYNFVGKTFVVTTRFWVQGEGAIRHRNPGDILFIIDSYVNGTSFCIVCLHSDGVNKLFSSNAQKYAFAGWIKELE